MTAVLLPAGHDQPVLAPTPRRGDRLRMALSRFGAAPMLLFWLVIVGILVLPIVLFLVVAVSPRLMDQGSQWFTLAGFRQAFTGQLLRGSINSLFVGAVSAVAATGIGFGVAWAVIRTDVPGRRLWAGSMYALLLAPSYLVALGWQRLLEPMGVLDLMGFHPGGFRPLFYGPFGVIVVLTLKGVPFSYLAVSAALRGLGEEFEVAARVHGASRAGSLRIVLSLLAPAMWSALAIVFAESISDFGVADTLANAAHFPIATYTLYNAIDSFPVSFPVAASVGWVLMAMAGLALAAQARALRGRSYRVLGGRSRPPRLARLSAAKKLEVSTALALLMVIALGVPVFGAVSASLINGLGSLVGNHTLTLANYRRVFDSSALRGPLFYSARLALVTATLTVAMAVISARMLAGRGGRLGARVLDLMLLTAVALPGIVFAAGYIFTYNLRFVNNLGVHLYETTPLLVLGYLATALPSTTRVLFGPIGQVQNSLQEAARVHGSGAAHSWMRTVLPVLARPLIAAWVLTFAGTLLELPVSQLLYPPNHPPVSIGITHALANYDYGGGTAMEVIAVLFSLTVVALVWGAFRVLAPAGWRRLGKATA
ncbi:MAG: iron ABC transporter permease [Acidobacteriota bacterium]|nr:iron ABC transporter permease [Acidobacteriota bacterium]